MKELFNFFIKSNYHNKQMASVTSELHLAAKAHKNFTDVLFIIFSIF